MSKEFSESQIRLQALSYILEIVLQRLDTREPGFIKELLDGVKADRDSSLALPHVDLPVPAIFNEAVRILERANSHNET